MREWKLRFVPLLLVGLVAGGCDSGGTDPGDVLADFDAAEITAVMESSSAPLEASAEANAMLGSFFRTVLGVSASERGPTIARLGDSPIRSLVRTASFGTDADIPAELLGQTFVWSTAEDAWVADASRTGAPADGVRVIWYVADQFGDIAVPLSERGYIDVRDVSTSALDRLAIEAVRTVGGTLTVADYIYGHRSTDDDVDWTEHVVLEGTFTDGTASLEVAAVLDDAGSWTTGDQAYRWSLSFDGPEGSYTWVLEGSLEGATETETGLFDVTVTRDGVATVLALDFEGPQDGAGTLSHRGVVIANIDMVDDDMVLSQPAGGSFTAEQATRLETVISTMIIYGPLLLFSLPFVNF